MGVLSESSWSSDARKPSRDMFDPDLAESPSPSCSAMGDDDDGIASPMDGKNEIYPTTERTLAPCAADPETCIVFKEKHSSFSLDTSDAQLLPSLSLSEDERPPPAYLMSSSSSPQLRNTNKALVCNRMVRFWEANRSCMLVVISSLFGSAMALFTKLLELDGGGLHPFQILFMRMAVTTVGCTAYLWWKRIPHSLLGQKGIRGLLLFRGISGFFGIFGIWSAIRKSSWCCGLAIRKETESKETEFLSLADATVITFLTPSMVGLFSAVFLHQPYTRKEQLASLVALSGVIFIARPSFLFSHLSYAPSSGGLPQPSIEVTPVSTVTGEGHPMAQGSSTGDETAALHLTGILLALLSALGGAGAFISIQSIGARAHVLTTTNTFSVCCTVISAAALTMAPLIGYDQPQLCFVLPQDSRQWVLVSGIIFCGFMTQWLLTMGISSEERSNKAPAMVYVGMLWTAGFDRWVFGQNMYWSSLLGCGLIVGSAIWVILMPKTEDRPMEIDDIENEAALRGPEAALIIADRLASKEVDAE